MACLITLACLLYETGLMRRRTDTAVAKQCFEVRYGKAFEIYGLGHIQSKGHCLSLNACSLFCGRYCGIAVGFPARLALYASLRIFIMNSGTDEFRSVWIRKTCILDMMSLFLDIDATTMQNTDPSIMTGACLTTRDRISMKMKITYHPAISTSSSFPPPFFFCSSSLFLVTFFASSIHSS